MGPASNAGARSSYILLACPSSSISPTACSAALRPRSVVNPTALTAGRSSRGSCGTSSPSGASRSRPFRRRPSTRRSRGRGARPPIRPHAFARGSGGCAGDANGRGLRRPRSTRRSSGPQCSCTAVSSGSGRSRRGPSSSPSLARSCSWSSVGVWGFVHSNRRRDDAVRVKRRRALRRHGEARIAASVLAVSQPELTPGTETHWRRVVTLHVGRGRQRVLLAGADVGVRAGDTGIASILGNELVGFRVHENVVDSAGEGTAAG